MKKTKQLLIFIGLVIAGNGIILAQSDHTFVGKSLGELKEMKNASSALIFGASFLMPSIQKERENKQEKTMALRPLPLAYSYDELAVFCKLEVKMEKAAKVPIKFRLGDVDYVDWLEGKRSYFMGNDYNPTPNAPVRSE